MMSLKNIDNSLLQFDGIYQQGEKVTFHPAIKISNFLPNLSHWRVIKLLNHLTTE